MTQVPGRIGAAALVFVLALFSCSRGSRETEDETFKTIVIRKDAVSIRVSWDPGPLEYGYDFVVHLAFDLPEGFFAAVPEIAAGQDDLRVESISIDENGGSITLTPLTEGEYSLPGILFVVTDGNTGDISNFESDPVPFTVKAPDLEITKDSKYEELKTPDEKTILPVLIPAVLLLPVLAASAFLLFRRKPKIPDPPGNSRVFGLLCDQFEKNYYLPDPDGRITAADRFSALQSLIRSYQTYGSDERPEAPGIKELISKIDKARFGPDGYEGPEAEKEFRDMYQEFKRLLKKGDQTGEREQ